RCRRTPTSWGERIAFPVILRDGMPTPGEDLVRAMAGGDRAAFARFYDRYAVLVFPLVLRIVGDRAGAVEVLQDVFWEAWRGAAAAADAALGGARGARAPRGTRPRCRPSLLAHVGGGHGGRGRGGGRIHRHVGRRPLRGAARSDGARDGGRQGAPGAQRGIAAGPGDALPRRRRVAA